QARWVGPPLGVVNGILTGMTGSFVVPGVLYLQALDFRRDALIQAMGMLFALSTLALALALGGNGLLTAEKGLWSAIALLPAIGGMILGQRIRQKISEIRFRQVFFVSLLVLGAYIILQALIR
ncbi:MAG: TSUP family transporter, partial [Gammaproteobacteria bacterium]